jgi:hypothetical protein
MLTETDERVLRFLSKQERKTADVGKNCFAGGTARRAKDTVLVAAAHLRRMESRGLVACRGKGDRLVWRSLRDGGGSGGAGEMQGDLGLDQ